MQITFGKSVYVLGTSPEMITMMNKSSLSTTMTDNGLMITPRESIDEFLKSYDNDMAEYKRKHYCSLKDFLQEVLETIDKLNDGTPIGDIFFVS